MLRPRLPFPLQARAWRRRQPLVLFHCSLNPRPVSTASKSVVVQSDPLADNLQPRTKTLSAQDGLWRLKNSVLIRNILLGWFFSSPRLVRLGIRLLDRTAHSKSELLNPDRNVLLRGILKPLLYSQFCAGVTKQEIAETRNLLLSVGYAGIILAYGKEFKSSDAHSSNANGEDAELKHWKDSNLETLDMIGSEDFLAVKFTGAGQKVTKAMMNNESPPADFRQAMDDICQKANSRGCSVWVDAEYQEIQSSIDEWAIGFMSRHNHERALVYNTIQAYLKSSRVTVQHHLERASKGGWHLGIKLVRGAYIGSDPRELIYDTKRETDTSYNSIARDLLSSSALAFKLPQGSFPRLNLFLAGHNPESISTAWELAGKLEQAGILKTAPGFGQLHGMGDHISCALLQRAQTLAKKQENTDVRVSVPKIYKYSVWGTVQECMMYLGRRARENSDGTDRIKDGISVYSNELRRRLLRR